MCNSVFCIGELLIDFIGKDINKGIKNGVIFEKKAGGAPANVAAAISRLGGMSYFLGQVGKDSFGDFLTEILKSENINTDMVVCEGNTTMAFVAIDENGERNFEFNRGSDGEYDFSSIATDKISKNDIIHFGSATAFLGGKLRDTYFKLLSYAKENNIFISFDPNYRDALISDAESFVKDCKQFIASSDFVKLSDEEIKLITKEVNIEDGVKALHDMGVKVVCVTLGSAGTFLSVNNESEIVPSISIKQVDSTGAGDAFVGAVLYKVSNYLDKREINATNWHDIIKFANRVGAITCTNYGAINSIPNKEELQNYKF